MSQLNLNEVIEQKKEVLKQLLLDGEYIICCDIACPTDLRTTIIQNVITIQKRAGMLEHRSIVQYTVTNNSMSSKFNLHDDLIILIQDEKMIDSAVKGMLDGYHLFILDRDNLDRVNIYCKLATDAQDEIVYQYQEGFICHSH